MRLFITGTDTDVGKTFVSALCMAAAKTQQFPLCYFKPIQTGADSDCDTVKHLAGLEENAIMRPEFSFALPAAPSRAAQAEGKVVTLAPIVQRLKQQDSACLVEGAGGILCPLGESLLIRDLILALNIPTLIVASTRLGTMNHTLLTLEAAKSAGILVKGVILSGAQDAGLRAALADCIDVPILAEIPRLAKVAPESLQDYAIKHFPRELLREIFLTH